MFAPKKRWPHSVPNFTRIAAVIFVLLLVSRVLSHGQDTTPTNPTLVNLVTLTVLTHTAYAMQGDRENVLSTASMAPSRSRSMRVTSPISRTPAAYKDAVETNWALPVAPDGSTKNDTV